MDGGRAFDGEDYSRAGDKPQGGGPVHARCSRGRCTRHEIPPSLDGPRFQEFGTGDRVRRIRRRIPAEIPSRPCLRRTRTKAGGTSATGLAWNESPAPGARAAGSERELEAQLRLERVERLARPAEARGHPGRRHARGRRLVVLVVVEVHRVEHVEHLPQQLRPSGDGTMTFFDSRRSVWKKRSPRPAL